MFAEYFNIWRRLKMTLFCDRIFLSLSRIYQCMANSFLSSIGSMYQRVTWQCQTSCQKVTKIDSSGELIGHAFFGLTE